MIALAKQQTRISSNQKEKWTDSVHNYDNGNVFIHGFIDKSN